MNCALVLRSNVGRGFSHGYCPQCNKANHWHAWCNRCDRKALVDEFNTWSTGNKDLDLFIQETQRTATCYVNDLSSDKTYLEYVPYDRFTDVESLSGLGDFAAGEVFTAIWLDGERVIKDKFTENCGKERSEPLRVSLEIIDNSTEINHVFIDEVIIGVCLFT